MGHLGEYLGQVRYPASQLINYAHNDLISDFHIFGIPDLKFCNRALKFGSIVGLGGLYEISSVFFRTPFRYFLTIFRISANYRHNNVNTSCITTTILSCTKQLTV